ncbi:MAG: Gfo/Idh/MocA family oxidoreductase [Fuerstiella sp.]|nr:Gfo/Idh/MocA family oxidoreductase [Fuerstiella sp.]
MNSINRIGVGVLGATGYIGKPYRAEIRDVADARIVALCARRRDLLEEAGEEDGADVITDNWREVVEHPDVDFVVVGTPDALHYEAVLAAAAARKHMFCEKPVGMNSGEAREMWQAYFDAGTLAHYVPFWTRYSAIFQKLKEIVDSGQLGEIRGVVYRWHNPRPANMPLTWRDDPELSAAGSIADVGSHAYDTVCWLLGTEATRVQAHAATITPSKADLGAINLQEALEKCTGPHSDTQQRQGGTPDYASVSWEFANGAVGVLLLSHATYFRKGICPELELHGTDASVSINRVTGDVILGDPDCAPKLVANIPDDGFGNRFEKYVFPVVRSVLAGELPGDHPNLENGWRVQCFTDAVVQSAKVGGWVNIST